MPYPFIVLSCVWGRHLGENQVLLWWELHQWKLHSIPERGWVFAILKEGKTPEELL